jgi:probable DNA metabolism protein
VDLFSEMVHVPTVDSETNEMRRRILACAGADEIETLVLVHASDAVDRHRLLLAYLSRTLAAGRSVAPDLAVPEVLAVRKIRDRVRLEIDRFLGLIRFRRVAGSSFYTPVNPDADIVGFIGPHFAQRFPDQDLIIHDVNRDIAFWTRDGESGIADLAGLAPAERSRLSTDCHPAAEELWRRYFAAIANPERRNPRLQRKLMPARYWKFMIEQPGGGDADLQIK